MRRYITKRLLQAALTFFVFLSLTYFLLEAQPGSYAQVFLANPRLTAEQREALAARFGLDRPPFERYLRYMDALLHGDLGTSLEYYPRNVMDVIQERAPRTIVLFLTATIVSFYVGFAAGKVLAWRRGQRLEYAATVGGVTLYTVFTPWFGLMMIWLFAVALNIFPIGKFITPELWSDAPVEANVIFLRVIESAIAASLAYFALLIATRYMEPRTKRTQLHWAGLIVILAVVFVHWSISGFETYAQDIVFHMILPVLTLTLISFAGTMLLTRNSMLETLREDYIVTARAKGLPEKVIRDKHAARNAMLPVVTSFVFSLAFAIGGGVITETIFSWPGMGLTVLEAATVKDIPMAMGGLIFVAILALLAHVVADILYAYLDPRIRYM